jgi:SAM-dependent methyltransferase
MKILPNKKVIKYNPILQRRAMVRKLEQRTTSEGKISFPAVPAMVEDYTNRCAQIFASCGRQLNDTERAQLHKNLDSQLREAFARSQRSSILVTYSATVAGLMNYFISPQYASLDQSYEAWIGTREPPYFGVAPDSKIMALAREVSSPGQTRILDIGAGTGRNTLPLARLGHPVDAVEVTPKFAQILSDSAQKEGLDVRVICKDVFVSEVDLRDDYAFILLSEVASDFRSTDQLRDLFKLASDTLTPGGQLIINAFLTRPNYCADDAVLQFAQQVYTNFFTYAELETAIQGLPLTLVSDEDVHDYEKKNLPAHNWPPTPWYPKWISGLDVLDVPRTESPITLNWLVFRKTV